VIGLHEEADKSISAFDIITEIDNRSVTCLDEVKSGEVLVSYLKRPFGKINLTPVEDRGWVFLERFITMLKGAMIDEESFSSCVFTNNSEQIETYLRDGARRLREAAEKEQNNNEAIIQALEAFKGELDTKAFSAASADKIANNAGFKANSDREVVSKLMDDLVVLFGEQWRAEQEKQKDIKLRFHTDVPLLTLTPKTWKAAFTSLQPVILVGPYVAVFRA